MSDKISAVWALCEILLFASTKSRQICARFLIPITTTIPLQASNATSQNPKHTSKIPNTSRVSKYTNIQIQLPKIHQECPKIYKSASLQVYSPVRKWVSPWIYTALSFLFLARPSVVDTCEITPLKSRYSLRGWFLSDSNLFRRAISSFSLFVGSSLSRNNNVGTEVASSREHTVKMSTCTQNKECRKYTEHRRVAHVVSLSSFLPLA